MTPREKQVKANPWDASESRLFLVLVASFSFLGLLLGPAAIVSEGVTALSCFLCVYGIAHFFVMQTSIAGMYDPPQRVSWGTNKWVRVHWYLSMPVIQLFPESRLYRRLFNEVARNRTLLRGPDACITRSDNESNN